MTMKNPPIPSLDADAIRTFCQTVFDEQAGVVPVRLLAEKGTPGATPRQEFPEPANLVQRLVALAHDARDEGRGLFVVPATVAAPGRARKEDIRQTRVVLVDLDEGDIDAAKDHLVEHLGMPTLEVASGGRTTDGQEKRHLYWKLSEIAKHDNLDRVAALREEIARKVGGDMSFKTLTQPIRVPGSTHGKHGKTVPVRLIQCRAVAYDLAEIEDAAANMPSMLPPPAGRGPVPAASYAAIAAQTVHEGGVDGVTRYAALSTVMGYWISMERHGACTRAEAWDQVRRHNAELIRPSWGETRLRQDFERLLLVDARNHSGSGTADEPPPLSEDALADAFVAAEGEDWRHVTLWHAWYHWNGSVWTKDETGLVRERMRVICRISARNADLGVARRIASDRTVTAALKLAATDPRISTTPDRWDNQPMSLNTQDGILDLATGEIEAHDRTRLITQMTNASAGTGCPRWQAFLGQITGGDDALKGYLQKLAGYCVTGVTTEQIFAFLHGHGANGKSVFLGTLAHVLGGYAATATLDTFSGTRSARHLSELAGLRAARLVVVPETESGQAWAEARIKAVTGGEALRVNFMHKDHFEYTPQFKLVVAGNHRPSLSNVGEALRRRLHLVPFEVTIPPNDRDKHLLATLRSERDGILGWMIEGCLLWQRHGLSTPERVARASQEYFASEDVVGQWIDDCCLLKSQAREASSHLFQSWKIWTEAHGIATGSMKSLGEALRARGLSSGKVNGGKRGWFGIALKRTRVMGATGQ